MWGLRRLWRLWGVNFFHVGVEAICGGLNIQPQHLRLQQIFSLQHEGNCELRVNPISEVPNFRQSFDAGRVV